MLLVICLAICLVKLIVSILVFSFMALKGDGKCLLSEYIAMISPFIIQYVWEFLFIVIAVNVFDINNLSMLLILTNILSVDLVAYCLYMMLFRATIDFCVLAVIKVFFICVWLIIENIAG